MTDKRFNLSNMPNKQDQQALKDQKRLDEKARKRSAKLKKQHQAAGAKIRTGRGE